MRIEIERLEAVLPATELVGVLKNEITRLRNQVEQLRSEVADAKKWAMQERSLRWAATTNSDEISRTVVDGDCALHNTSGDA